MYVKTWSNEMIGRNTYLKIRVGHVWSQSPSSIEACLKSKKRISQKCFLVPKDAKLPKKRKFPISPIMVWQWKTSFPSGTLRNPKECLWPGIICRANFERKEDMVIFYHIKPWLNHQPKMLNVKLPNLSETLLSNNANIYQS